MSSVIAVNIVPNIQYPTFPVEMYNESIRWYCVNLIYYH